MIMIPLSSSAEEPLKPESPSVTFVLNSVRIPTHTRNFILQTLRKSLQGYINAAKIKKDTEPILFAISTSKSHVLTAAAVTAA